MQVIPLSVKAQTDVDGGSIREQHRDRVENLRRVLQTGPELASAIHTLIVPTGSLARIDYPIPVARIRYEQVPLFDFDNEHPRAEFVEVLKRLAATFREDRSLARIAVVGHTDSVGTDAYNYALSLKRAASIAMLLAKFGVPTHKVTIHPMGEARHIASNETARGRALNRRVEFLLSSIPEAIPPSISNSPYHPARNDHPECRKAPHETQCVSPLSTRVPTHALDAGGNARPTGESIVVGQNTAVNVQEVAERLHVPIEKDERPILR